jgi:deoxyribodipyrimidine photo-lyase
MTNLIWFRNDLRVNDNTSIYEATQNGAQTIAVYCFDPKQFIETKYGFKKTEKYRAKFLIETIQELRVNLSEKNIPLLVYHDAAENRIPKLVTEFQIDAIFTQKEWTSEEQKVNFNLKNKLQNIQLIESYDQFLFHPDDIPFENFKNLPEVFTVFRKQCEKEVTIRETLIINKHPKRNWFDNDTQIPTLTDLGFENFEPNPKTAFPFQGGENQALKRVVNYFWETKSVSKYKQTRNGLIGSEYSSKLSAWLANGSISAKIIYWKIKQYEQEVGANEDTYWLVFELIWRDYFKFISLKHGSKIFKLDGILEKSYDWIFNQSTFNQWMGGMTSEPFVNANMIELAQTGYMSNRGRQNVASYWAKECKQDWRVAAQYFESMLIDYDVHSNYGNWMYNAGVGNDPRDRKFNIKRQAEMYDKNRAYQELWLNKS